MVQSPAAAALGGQDGRPLTQPQRPHKRAQRAKCLECYACSDAGGQANACTRTREPVLTPFALSGVSRAEWCCDAAPTSPCHLLSPPAGPSTSGVSAWTMMIASQILSPFGLGKLASTVCAAGSRSDTCSSVRTRVGPGVQVGDGVHVAE